MHIRIISGKLYNKGIIVLFLMLWGAYISAVAQTKYEFKGKRGSSGLTFVMRSNKCGYINDSGKEVVPLIYEYESSYSSEKGYLEKWNNELLVRVKRNGKYGMVNAQGHEVIPPIYDEIVRVCIENDSDYIRFRKSGKYGMVNSKNLTVIPFDYDDLEKHFLCPLIYAKLNGKYGFIDKNNKVVAPFKYDATNGFRYSDAKMAPVSMNGKYGYIDISGQEVIPFKYEFADCFSQGLAAVVSNGKVGFITESGELAIPFLYDAVYSYGNLESSFWPGYAIVKKDKWGMINKEGKVLIPFIYDSHSYYNSSMIVLTRNRDKFYFDKAGNKYYSEVEFREKSAENMAKQGYADAQYELGKYYYFGRKGYTKDYGQAFQWFNRSALGGNEYAQYYLGWQYEYGQGTTKDINLAKKWYGESAKKGYQQAIERLAKLEGETDPNPSPKPSPRPVRAKPSLSWTLPDCVYSDRLSIQVKVKSQSKIESGNVSVNGATRGISSVVNDGADFLISREVTLQPGMNNILVEVANSAGMTSETKTVRYLNRQEETTPKPQPKPNSVNNTSTQRRLALVIGNASYQYVDKLAKTTNDASDIATKLRQFGFTVIEKQNLSQVEFNRAISDFGQKASGYDVSLFYYAGHAIESDGINYLIPTDAKVEQKVDLMTKCVNANFILESLQDAKSKTNIIVLDACRDNPFKASWARSRGASGGGLAHMEGSDGTYFMFATSPGKEAYDGNNRNSPFTSAFLTSLDRSANLPLELFAKQVVRLTLQNSNSTQRPWIAGSLLGDFYFKQK